MRPVPAALILRAVPVLPAVLLAMAIGAVWPTDAAAGQLTLKAFPDTPITGDVDMNEPEAPFVRFSAFGTTAQVPRDWIEALVDDDEDLEVPKVEDDNDGSAWCDQGETLMRRGESRRAKRAFKKAFDAAAGLDRARAGWLRFEIEDMVKDLLRKPDKVNELFDPFAGSPSSSVVVEYCAWLHACTALQVRGNRDRLATILRSVLDKDRKAYLTLVAKSSGRGHEYDERTAAALAELLGRIELIANTPAKALALTRAFRSQPAERFDALQLVADRLRCRDALDTCRQRGADLLAGELPPSAVARVPSDALTQANEAVREFNAAADGIEISDREKAYVMAANDYRETLGLQRMQLSKELMEAAHRHTKDMAGRRVLGHGGSDGSSPQQRARRAGYPEKTLIAENVQRTAGAEVEIAKVLRAWQESPGHHANILRSGHAFTGVGCDDIWWTQVFGTAPSGR